jgi:hypothetical protein
VIILPTRSENLVVRAELPESFGSDIVTTIVDSTPMPAGAIALVLGDDLLETQFQAVSIPRGLIRYADDICGLSDIVHEPWDVGVSIGTKWTDLASQYPCYFSYLVAHELGHAATALRDLDLTCFEDLILRSIKSVASHVSRWDDLPHEARYDQFGLATAYAVHGESAVREEFARLQTSGETADPERLENTIARGPRHDLSGLKAELAGFTAPYKAELLEMWTRRKQSIAPGVTQQIADLESLWN